jgi:hypothetical protein
MSMSAVGSAAEFDCDDHVDVKTCPCLATSGWLKMRYLLNIKRSGLVKLPDSAELVENWLSRIFDWTIFIWYTAHEQL